MPPLVSIIIPSYNRVQLIGETLDSVLAQTYQDWECIVVDDGSHDATHELMGFYCEKDSRIRYYHRPTSRPKGANACRNYGFEVSKGEYIQWLDSDDLLSNDKLKNQIQDLRGLDVNTLAICKFGYLDTRSKRKFIRENINIYMDYSNGKYLLVAFGKYSEYIPLHVYLTPRRLIQQTHLWNESLKINQDAEFYSRLLLLNSSIKFSNTHVYYRITNQDNISFIDTAEKAQAMINSWMLINEHIKKSGFSAGYLYIEQAKKNLHQRLKDKFPYIVEDNQTFFHSILPFHKRLLRKLF